MAIQIHPRTRLSNFRDAHVELACKACLHEREMPALALAQIIGWETRIATAIPRMRCSACGAHRAHVSIFYPRKPRGGRRIRREAVWAGDAHYRSMR